MQQRHDTPEVVRRYYSWIDEEAVLTDVQNFHARVFKL
jgi:hypothetical protein